MKDENLEPTHTVVIQIKHIGNLLVIDIIYEEIWPIGMTD